MRDKTEIPAPVKTKSGAKPRDSRAGTRSVDKLSKEQLARKRANDRKAQQVLRQRTRDCIERLEKRIKELSSEASSDDPEFDLAFEEAQRRNGELEKELAWLRKVLESNDGTSLFQQQLQPEHQVQQPSLPYQAQEHPMPLSHFTQYQQRQQNWFQQPSLQHQNQLWQITPQYFPPQEQERWYPQCQLSDS